MKERKQISVEDDPKNGRKEVERKSKGSRKEVERKSKESRKFKGLAEVWGYANPRVIYCG